MNGPFGVPRTMRVPLAAAVLSALQCSPGAVDHPGSTHTGGTSPGGAAGGSGAGNRAGAGGVDGGGDGGGGADAGGGAGTDAADGPPDAGCGLRWHALAIPEEPIYGRRVTLLDRWVVLWAGEAFDAGWSSRITVADLREERAPPNLRTHLAPESWGGLASSGGRVFSGPGLGGPAGGEVLDPALGTLEPVDATGAPTPRSWHTATAIPGGVVVWGGFALSGEALDSGGLLDTTTGTWAALPRVGSPVARGAHATVWTGEELLVWGGRTAAVSPSEWIDGGERYRPATGEWRAMSGLGGPGVRRAASVVWTGRELVVWGGYPADPLQGRLPGGVAWDPTVDGWRRIPDPPRAAGGFAVWTGRHLAVLVVPGGGADLYDPVGDRWSTIDGCGEPVNCDQGLSVDALWSDAQLVVVCSSKVFVGTLDEP